MEAWRLVSGAYRPVVSGLARDLCRIAADGDDGGDWGRQTAASRRLIVG